MWKSHSLQLVWFLPSPTVPDVADLYQSATGHRPSAFQSGENPFANVPTVSSASGFLNDLTLNFQAQAGRIDVVAAPHVNPTFVPPTGPPTFADTKSAVEQLLDLAGPISDLMGLSARLAFVCNVTQPVADQASANGCLSSAIGLPLPDRDVLDFSFVLNKRLPLESVPGVLLNRVLSWSVGVMQQMNFGPPAGTSPAVGVGGFMPLVPNQPTFSSYYSANVAIDVNTSSDTGALYDAAEARKIFSNIRKEIVRLSDNPSVASLLA